MTISFALTRTFRLAAAALAAPALAASLLALSLADPAQAQTPAPAANQAPAEKAPAAEAAKPAPKAPVKEQQALDLLKEMSAKIAAAKSFSVSARSMREVLSTEGNMLLFFDKSQIELKRPNKLHATVFVDGNQMVFNYDGKKFVAFDPAKNLFTAIDAPATLDETLKAMAGQGIQLAVADFLFSDPYAALTQDLTTAYVVKDMQIHNTKVKHVAFAGKGIEWQIWINTDTKLPHLLAVTFTDTERNPHVLVEMKNWKLDADLPDSAFAFNPPAEAVQIEFLPVQ